MTGKKLISLLLLPFCLGCTFNKVEVDVDFKNILKNYRKWEKPVQEVLTYPIPGHGQGARIIYANNIAFKPVVTMKDGRVVKSEMKDGAVIIEEVYFNEEAVGKKEPMLTIMVKDRKSTRSINGWLFFVKKPGEIMSLITGKMCIGCHEAANEKHIYFDKNINGAFRDYLFVPFIKEQTDL